MNSQELKHQEHVNFELKSLELFEKVQHEICNRINIRLAENDITGLKASRAH